MPRMVPPSSDWPEALEAAVHCFGSSPKAMVIAYLERHPKSFKSEIAEGTGLNAATLQNQIEQLLAWGIVISDIPEGKRGRGRASRYSTDTRRIVLLLDTLRGYLLSDDSSREESLDAASLKD